MNTYGFYSINLSTFNLGWFTPKCEYSRQNRNILVTFLKLHNLALNILGYLPETSFYSGSTRIGTGIAICVITLAKGDQNTQKNMKFLDRFYYEAFLTGITQIGRGILEAFVSFGRKANVSIDSLATVYNIESSSYWTLNPPCPCCCNIKPADFETSNMEGPFPDPEYPFPLTILDLA